MQGICHQMSLLFVAMFLIACFNIKTCIQAPTNGMPIPVAPPGAGKSRPSSSGTGGSRPSASGSDYVDVFVTEKKKNGGKGGKSGSTVQDVKSKWYNTLSALLDKHGKKSIDKTAKGVKKGGKVVDDYFLEHHPKARASVKAGVKETGKVVNDHVVPLAKDVDQHVIQPLANSIAKGIKKVIEEQKQKKKNNAAKNAGN